MSSDRQSRIRNFSIVAHIDHGKSTLADRLIQRSGLLTEEKCRHRFLIIWTLKEKEVLQLRHRLFVLFIRQKTDRNIHSN